MEETQHIPAERTSNWVLYILIDIIIVIASYFAITACIRIISPDDINGTAVALAFWTLLGVASFVRYLTHLGTSKNRTIPPSLLIGLTVLIAVTLVWHFMLSQSLLQGRKADDFMLFGVLLLFGVPFLLLSMAVGTYGQLLGKGLLSQLQTAKAQTEQTRSELNLLQSQLSPNFLFNTLHNMYGISINQPGKTPVLLLKLSGLLRYAVFDTRELLVPLEHEIAYINFEKIRIGERLAVKSKITHIEGYRAFIHASEIPIGGSYREEFLKALGL